MTTGAVVGGSAHVGGEEPPWVGKLSRHLKRLSPADRYLCAAGIPGPMMELRSGAVPVSLARGTGIADYIPRIAEATGLDQAELRRRSKEIARQYRLPYVLRRMSAIAADFQSRVTLLQDVVRGTIRRYRGLASDSNPAATTRQVRLRVRGGVKVVEYPANLVSVGMIWEIFAEEVYLIEEPVERIYDFGANTGLATLYLSAAHPGAELVCVEPFAENVALLERNIERNRINARVIKAVAGLSNGEATLTFSDQSHALPSLHTRQASQRTVPMVRFDEIVRGNNYGLKVDIEGSESDLEAFPQIVRNACWIAGEVHYSGDEEHDRRVDGWMRLIDADFVVTRSRSTIYFVGDDVLLCQSFKATRPL